MTRVASVEPDTWTKSATCESNACVEVGVWKTSTLSGPHDDACVQVAGAEDGDVLVRDTKDKGDGPVLRFTHAEFSAFVAGVKLGEFDVD
jgi:Domain of unknown function (DUF397)